jgi:ADP-heptose:LPS heptosyltransferase
MKLKNFLFNLLTARRKKVYRRQDPDSPRILVVSTTGLGDSLWGTPAVRAIKKHFPNGNLSLLTSQIGQQVYRNNPNIDDIFVIKDPALFSLLNLFPQLKRKQFDTALIFHFSWRPVLPFTYLAGPENIIGTEGINKGLDHLLSHPIKNKPIHEIERRLKIAEVIGVPPSPPEMEFFLTEEENSAALSFLHDTPYYVGMHPGSKDRFKQWNPKHFIAIGRRLAKEKNAKILITGDKSESKLATSIAENIPGARSLAGKLPMRVTAALIEKLDLFITNDTGPMHLAFAMGTPTIAVFSPTDPKLCGPYHIPHGKVIQKPRTCHPCIKKQCQVPFCMEQISPEEVWEHCLSV